MPTAPHWPAPSPAAPDAEDVTEVGPETTTVACDGGGLLGHPMTYYTFGGSGTVVCGYCGRTFVRRGGAAAGDH
jgi:uncharacterized Zn-finger protein